MDAVNSPNPKDASFCFGYSILLSNWMDAVNSYTIHEFHNLHWLPILLINKMSDVYSSNPKDASSYCGYQILLSSGRDAVKSFNLDGCSSGMDAEKSPNPNVC